MRARSDRQMAAGAVRGRETPGGSRDLCRAAGWVLKAALQALPARWHCLAGLVVPMGELPELAQSAPPARYEGPGRKVIVGATG